MRTGKARQRLHPKQEEVAAWATAVPARAARFHAVRKQLQQQMADALPSWRPFVDDQQVARCEERAQRLSEVVHPLIDLARNVERTEADVQRFGQSGPGLPADTTGWILKRCVDWKVRLDRLVKTCERLPDVYRDEAVRVTVENELAAAREALYQLREAERLAAAHAANARAAELIAHLPAMRAQLFASGPTPQWLDEMRRLIEPVKILHNQINDPPPQVVNLGTLLTELRFWAKYLAQSDAPVQRIEERRNVAAGDWQTGDVEALLAEARTLRERYVEEAEQLRREALRELEDALADLRQARDDQPELERRLIELREISFAHAHAFREWKDELERFRQNFYAVAQTNIGALQQLLAAGAARIRAKLEDLGKRALSDEVGASVVVLRQELRAFPKNAQVEELLLLLRRCNVMETIVDGLVRQAEEDLRAIVQWQEQLAVRNAALQAERLRIKGAPDDIVDLSERIAQLSQPGPEESLEERRREAQAVVGELDALTARFLEHCHARVEERRAAVQRLVDALRRAGVSSTPPASRDAAGELSPHDAAEAVLEMRRFHQGVKQRARRLSGDLEAQLQRRAAELAKLPLDNLAPGDRQTAGQLVVDLEASQPPHALPERLEALAILAARSDQFFDRLQQEERDAREQLEKLRRRFRAFSEEQLDRYFPEHVARVAALLHGIPERPRVWSAVHHQLEQAAALFTNVEEQSRRIAAEDLERAVAALRRDGGNGSGAVTDELLAELKACGDEVLPPIALRQRAMTLSRQV